VTSISVDRDVCLGSSACTFHAPNTFAIGDDGLAYVVDPEGDQREDVWLAAADCPTQAIRLDG
jgi:ferredoxin